MTYEIVTEVNGSYTHYYAKHPTYSFDKGLYLGLSAKQWVRGIDGNYVPSWTHTLIHFTPAYYAANDAAFLPGEIIVENDKVWEFIQRAAEWYSNEYDLYLTGRDAAWEETDTIPDED